MNFCGLDVGTSGVKAVVFNEKGEMLKKTYFPYNTEFDPSGLRGLDAREVWKQTKAVLKSVCSAVPVNAIAAASFGESFVFLDERDNILNDIMIYTDRRGETEFLREAKKTSPAEIAEICGLPFSPTYSISKLLYLKENRPEIYHKAKRSLFVQDFVSYQLSGNAAVDYSLASRSMLFDAREYKWSERMTGLFGIDPALFSRPVPAGTVVGTIKKELAEELGAPYDTIIVAGAHDQPAAAIGAGLREKTAGCSMGTTECTAPVFEGMIPAEVTEKEGLSSEPMWNGKYCTLAYNPSSGLLIEWFCKVFAAEETRTGGMGAALTAFGEHFPEKPTRLMVQPFLAGSATPSFDYLARFALTGAGTGTTRYDIYRAVLEGLALDQNLNLRILRDHGVDVQAVSCGGGGSKNAQWLQIKADVMQIPMHTMECGEAGALGCAALCAAAAGEYASVEEAARNMSRITGTFEPNPENRAFYEEKFEQYRVLREHLMSESAYACRG